MEDEKIVDLYWNRDPQAIEQSEEKYGHYCFTVAQNVLGDYEDSRECVNDTWLAAWNRIPPARPVVLRMFLAKLARRISVNRLKANRAGKRGGGELPMVLEELSECLPGKGTVEDEVLGRELGACINRFVKGLTICARRAIFMNERKRKSGQSPAGLEPVQRLYESMGDLAEDLLERSERNKRTSQRNAKERRKLMRIAVPAAAAMLAAVIERELYPAQHRRPRAGERGGDRAGGVPRKCRHTPQATWRVRTITKNYMMPGLRTGGPREIRRFRRRRRGPFSGRACRCISGRPGGGKQGMLPGEHLHGRGHAG